MGAKDPLASMECVATNEQFTDPAIDMTEPDGEVPDGQPAPLCAADMLEEYRKTRDLSVLRFKPEMQKTVFVVQKLSSAYLMSVLRNMPESTRLMVAFCSAVHEIRTSSATSLKPTKIEDVSYGTKLADSKLWCDVVSRKYGVATIEEMGRVALTFARLREDQKGPFV